MSGRSWFRGVGVELEYMIVDRDTLDVLPVADRVLEAAAGRVVNEVERGPLRWSNELALHVIELKTNGPAASLDGLAGVFGEHLGQIDRLLEPLGGRLMPTAMHPWMDPLRESRLWPHDNSPIYDAYHRIFGCRGHGWTNLQSLHLNLPFQGDEQFGRLHAAIRLLLPILPALAASSPVADGRLTGLLDTRLEVYRTNQAKVPSLAGAVIPEAVFTRRAYQEELLQGLYRDIAPLDPEGVLQEEWLNSRGAIARFERDTIEIRVIDVQETPAADMAVAHLAQGVLQALTEERWSPYPAQQAWEVTSLAALFREGIRSGERAVIRDAGYLGALGFPGPQAEARELWAHLAAAVRPRGGWDPAVERAVAVLLEHGPLARRLLVALGPAPDRAALRAVYRELCGCLAGGHLFVP